MIKKGKFSENVNKLYLNTFLFSFFLFSFFLSRESKILEKFHVYSLSFAFSASLRVLKRKVHVAQCHVSCETILGNFAASWLNPARRFLKNVSGTSPLLWYLNSRHTPWLHFNDSSQIPKILASLLISNLSRVLDIILFSFLSSFFSFF